MSQVGYLSAQINKAHFDSMMRNCEIYVNHYKPTYIIDKDKKLCAIKIHLLDTR